MTENWESLFKNKGALWGFEPSDSAMIALELFKSTGIADILIPGFGYGRNAKLFHDAGFKITGIEISQSAIELARENGLNCNIYHGSVTSMPYDDQQFGGIFCYALVHLLNRSERKAFLRTCFSILKPGGIMVFTVVSKQAANYGNGRLLSSDRFEITKGVNVYYYDPESVKKEFGRCGLTEFRDIDEPIKFMTNQEHLKCILVNCRKEN